MIWTKKQPTKEGWYWFRRGDTISQRCVSIYWNDLRTKFYVTLTIWACSVSVDHWSDAEWAGPIEEPTD